MKDKEMEGYIFIDLDKKCYFCIINGVRRDLTMDEVHYLVEKFLTVRCD